MLDRYHLKGTLTGDLESDAFLASHAAAPVLGLLFDQRVRAEVAFTGPQRLYQRIGHLDMARLATFDPEELRHTFAPPPLAVHRFSNKMADYTRRVAQIIVSDYRSDPTNLWSDGAHSVTIRKRLQAMPGFGPGKSVKMKFVLHYLGYRDFSDEEVSDGKK